MLTRDMPFGKTPILGTVTPTTHAQIPHFANPTTQNARDHRYRTPRLRYLEPLSPWDNIKARLMRPSMQLKFKTAVMVLVLKSGVASAKDHPLFFEWYCIQNHGPGTTVIFDDSKPYTYGCVMAPDADDAGAVYWGSTNDKGWECVSKLGAPPYPNLHCGPIVFTFPPPRHQKPIGSEYSSDEPAPKAGDQREYTIQSTEYK